MGACKVLEIQLDFNRCEILENIDCGRARHYDPNTGRFLTKDPIGFASGDTNMYRYVMNDPINRTDPTGLWAVVVGGGFSDVLGGGAEGSAGIYIGSSPTGGLDAGGFFSGGSGCL